MRSYTIKEVPVAGFPYMLSRMSFVVDISGMVRDIKLGSALVSQVLSIDEIN